MDLENFIWVHIEEHSTNILRKLVSQFIKSDKFKKQFIDVILEIYCKHFINNNIWVLQRISRLCDKKLKVVKSKEYCMEILNIFIEIHKENGGRSSSFDIPPLSTDIRKYITDLSYGYEEQYEKECLKLYKTILNGNVFNLLNIIVNNIIREASYMQTFSILSYLFSLTNKQVFLIPKHT